MKPHELRNLTDAELDAELHRLKEELFTLRIQHKTGRATNPVKMRILRKDIARILTIKRERELGIKHEKKV